MSALLQLAADKPVEGEEARMPARRKVVAVFAEQHSAVVGKKQVPKPTNKGEVVFRGKSISVEAKKSEEAVGLVPNWQSVRLRTMLCFACVGIAY